MKNFKVFMNEEYYRIDHGKAPTSFSGNQSHGHDDSGKEIKGVYATHKKHAIGHAYAVPREVPWVFHHHNDGQKHLYVHKDHKDKVENHTATLSKFHKSNGFRGIDGGDEENVSKKNEKPHTQTKINSANHIRKQGIKIHYVDSNEFKQKAKQTGTDKSLKAGGNENVNEEMTFKVEVEGLPALFMSGNSPGQVKNHLRKLIKQPSMIKSVERKTKHDVKKMYRAKAQGKEVEEMTQQSKELPNLKIAVGKSAQSVKDTKARSDKRRKHRSGTPLAAGVQYETLSDNRPDHEIMHGSQGDARRKHDAVHGHGAYHKLPSDQKMKLHRKEIDQRFADRGRKPPKYTVKHTGNKVGHVGSFEIHHTPLQKVRDRLRTPTKTEATVDYGTDKSVEIMKKITPGQTELSELSPATIKSYKKKASDSNYKAASRFARIAGSPTSRKYKNKEMDKQADIMRKRKAGLAMADKKVDEKLTIGKIRRAAYKTGKVLGDVQAVKKNKVGKRVARRAVGKVAGKLLGKLFK